MKRHPRGEVRVYREDGRLVAGTSCAGYLQEVSEWATGMGPEIVRPEQLEALTVGSVILSYGWAWQLKTVVTMHTGEDGDSYAQTDPVWNCGERSMDVQRAGNLLLPATVLHVA